MVYDYEQEDDDLLISSGDFVVSESTQQHQHDLLRFKKGDLRQYPKTGVAIDDFLQDENPGGVYREIQRQFEADGQAIKKLDVFFNTSTNKLEPHIEAYYR